MLSFNSFLLHPAAKTMQWDEIRSQPTDYFININEERVQDVIELIDPFYIAGQ